jgi:hypothetical protein
MREVLAEIAGGVPPAAVGVNGAGFLAVEGEMAVGFVHAAGAAFFLEEVDGVGQGVALEEEALDFERVGMDGMIAGSADEIVSAFGGERVEVQGPEIPVAPFFDRAGVLRGDVEELVMVRGVMESAGSELVRGIGEDYGVFGAVGVVADLVGEDFGFVGAGGGEHSDAKEGDGEESIHGASFLICCASRIPQVLAIVRTWDPQCCAATRNTSDPHATAAFEHPRTVR